MIALARAELSRAGLVVLDEATSQLDAGAEAVAEAAFTGRTVIVVAHRLAAAVRADRVLLLHDDGAECGPHAQLLRSSARYRALVEHDGVGLLRRSA